MNNDELKYLLREIGCELAQKFLDEMNASLYYTNLAMKNRMIEYANKDPQGFTQISSILGHMRSINLDESLKSMGFESDLFNKKASSKLERADLLVEESVTESRGCLTNCSNKRYGVPRGGKYSLDHGVRIYFISREKINPITRKIESLLFQILYIDSSKFEKMKSTKVNMTQLKKLFPEDIIGQWEVFSKENDQTRF